MKFKENHRKSKKSNEDLIITEIKEKQQKSNKKHIKFKEIKKNQRKLKIIKEIERKSQ